MPRSAIIYTSPQGLNRLRDLGRTMSEDESVPVPFTISPGQRIEKADTVRVRVTELEDGAFLPLIRKELQETEVLFASSSDRDVRDVTYEDLLGDASPRAIIATLQYASPVIMEMPSGESSPFPLVSVVLKRYRELWNRFAEIPISLSDKFIESVKVVDFALSCRATPFGPGAQGWMTIGLGLGRNEQEIGFFNALIDFSLYSGTGFHTAEGLGQTRRMEGGPSGR